MRPGNRAGHVVGGKALDPLSQLGTALRVAGVVIHDDRQGGQGRLREDALEARVQVLGGVAHGNHHGHLAQRRRTRRAGLGPALGRRISLHPAAGRGLGPAAGVSALHRALALHAPATL